MKIISTKEISTRSVKCLIVAPSGSGKTTLAKTLRDKTLIINLEQGLAALHGTDIDTVDIASEPDIKKRYIMLQEVSKYLATAEAKAIYKNVFIDSISELSQLMYNILKLKYPDRKDNLVVYGELADNMKSFIKFYRDIPEYSVFMTALSVIEKDEQLKRYHAIDLIGKISGQVEAYFDLVMFLRIIEDEKGQKRVLQTSKQDSYPCKDRFGKLDIFEQPDLSAIKQKILS